MFGATVEPSLPGFDDSWLLDIDVTGISEVRPQDEITSEPQSDTDSYYGILKHSRHRGSRSRRNTPDQGQQPLSEGSYALGQPFGNSPWEVESMFQSEKNLSRPLNQAVFDCFATDSVISEQALVASRSWQPARPLVPHSCPKERTRKRRRLSDSTKEKVKSVRKAEACLRCRIYREPV